jgi:hypothetical protein
MSLYKLEELLKDYSPLMNDSTERAVEKVMKFGVAFSEVSLPCETQQDVDTF